MFLFTQHDDFQPFDKTSHHRFLSPFIIVTSFQALPCWMVFPSIPLLIFQWVSCRKMANKIEQDFLFFKKCFTLGVLWITNISLHSFFENDCFDLKVLFLSLDFFSTFGVVTLNWPDWSIDWLIYIQYVALRWTSALSTHDWYNLDLENMRESLLWKFFQSKIRKKNVLLQRNTCPYNILTNVTVDGALESFVSGVLHHVKLLIRDQTKRCVWLTFNIHRVWML